MFPGAFLWADTVSAILLLWFITRGHSALPYPLFPSLRENVEFAKPCGTSNMVDANNQAVIHMRSVYRHPFAGNNLFVRSIWAVFWALVLSNLAFFFLWIVGTWDESLRWDRLAWAWASEMVALVLFVAIHAGSYVRAARHAGTPLFWEDRCTTSLQRIRQNYPHLATYIDALDMEPPPWWWLFSRDRTYLAVKMANTLPHTLPLMLLGVSLFWGWCSLYPPAVVQPFGDTLVFLLAILQGMLLFWMGAFLWLEMAAWSGATNKAYRTFSLSVLQHDLRH